MFKLKPEKWIGFFRAQEESVFQAEKAACAKCIKPVAPAESRGAKAQGAGGGDVGETGDSLAGNEAGRAL